MNKELRIEKILEPSHSPFKEELVSSEFKRNRIKKFISDPEKIVRIHSTGAPLEVLRKEIEIGKTIFEDLRNIYHVPIPNFEFVIGPYINEEIPFAYTWIERVHGENLAGITFSAEQKERAKNQLDALYSSLVQYFRDAYEEKRTYLSDVTKPEQYVYGKRRSDSQDSVYLVDLDYFRNNDFSTADSYEAFFNNARWLYFDIKNMEKKVGIPLNNAIQRFREFIASVDASDPYYGRIEDLKEILNA